MNRTEAIQYVRRLVDNGRKVGVISCRDPYNTPFHRDVLNLSPYVLLDTQIGSAIDPSTLDLGLQAKGIDAWGIFGHYGIVDGHEVCAAIKSMHGGNGHYGPDLTRHLLTLSEQFRYNPSKSVRYNVVDWVKNQHDRLQRLIPEKQRTLQGAVQGDIVIFGGLVENSSDGKDYKAEVLFSNVPQEEIAKLTPVKK